MSTAEDVFYLYERNSSYYHNCNKQGKIDECPDNFSNECYCYTKQEILPLTIGNQFVPCSIKRRCYIRPGQECPICLDQKVGYSLPCNHKHFVCCQCLVRLLNDEILANGQIKCPMCRALS